MRPEVFIKKNGSTILTCVSAVGVVGTAVLTVKSTTKASYILEEAKNEKGEELSKLEKIKVAAPIYIPPILLGVSTISCIFGANILNKKAQASLVSSYALLDQSFKEYRNKVIDIYGEESDKAVKEQIEKDHCPRTR